jgi:ABC-type sugar transport system ATPase subunit
METMPLPARKRFRSANVLPINLDGVTPFMGEISMPEDYLLEMTGITKNFLGVRALDGVGLRIRSGEVHALMGENGAGKSTLIKILTGIYAMDAGDILFDGKKISPRSALEAQRLGISSIYQELNLIPYLSVAENIYLGHEARKYGMIDWDSVNWNASRLLSEHFGLNIDVRQPLNKCSTAEVQLTALARAISFCAKLVVMDEATSSLEPAEVDILFNNIHRLKEKGVAVLYITHKLDEIYRICDRVTILKDGLFVNERPVKELSKLELISSMIGRDASDIIGQKKRYRDFSGEEVVCKAIQVACGNKVRDISLSIRRGEIVGLSGLLGSGRTEFAKVLFGADRRDSGRIAVKGRNVSFRIPKHAIRAGMAFCSEDRKEEGIMPHMTVQENIVMAILPRLARAGVVNRRKSAGIVNEFIDKLRIKTPSQHQLIRNLSGGNQQKVILARWLCMRPDFIILDEPTRGIDVGAKAEIEALIQELAASGVAVLYISSEFEELVRGCDRIIVLHEGRDVSTLSGDEISNDAVLDAIARGGKPREAAAYEP